MRFRSHNSVFLTSCFPRFDATRALVVPLFVQGDGGDGGDADVDVGAGASGQARVEAGHRAKGGQPREGVGEIGIDYEHARLDGESSGGSDEEKDSTDGGEKGREDETRSEERHVEQGYD